MRARIEELDLEWFAALVRDLLIALRERFDAGGLPDDPGTPRDPDRADIDAVIELRRICRGWSDVEPPSVETSGVLELTAIVEDTKLAPELWATASTCRTALDVGGTRIPVMLDGFLFLYLYDRLPGAEGGYDFWVGYAGDVGRDGEVRALSIDFRAREDGVEFRHAVSDGTIIVRIEPSGFSLRGSNAGVLCDLVTASCEESSEPRQ